MEDPEPGAGAPQGGASGGGGAEPHATIERSDRNSGPSDDVTATMRPDRDVPHGKTQSKKRRKRRRGRKVFASDMRPGNANDAPVNGVSMEARALNEARSARNVNAPPVAITAPPVAARPQRTNDLPVYAALDLGTNNCRLLVAIPTRPGQFRVIDAFSRIVRLGEGLTASGRLGQPAMDRAVEALKICAEKLKTRHVRKARLIATEACRSAENGQEFLDRVQVEAGLSLEIIDRKTEARLAVSGCGSLIERDTDGVVLFDIGGGSSEIALVDVSRHRTPRLANHIVSWTSLPVGVVSLAERFGGRDVTPGVFRAMVDEVSSMLDRFDGRTRLAHLASGSRFHLLGTSGTVTTLAGIHLRLERYDRRRVDGLWLDNADVDAMIAQLLGWTFDERVANPCIGADRADLVLAGCAILEGIRRHWPSERLRVADRGLREGMLSELMADDGVWRRNRRRGAPAQ
ncbi:Ppx/GppA phosphatase family protein [Mesorhizobium sp. CAU 1732]|uniref:Ppx/GppA phosphatase family protein n=1 Tax=Mesorhizobium sp. CAU 1732 TaxID=3140358 RepID=UPI003261BDCB